MICWVANIKLMMTLDKKYCYVTIVRGGFLTNAFLNIITMLQQLLYISVIHICPESMLKVKSSLVASCTLMEIPRVI